MLLSRHNFLPAVAILASLPASLHAHRQWLLPSSTVLSSADAWVTIDAAVSNELFYFDHVPLRLANLVVTGPDGVPVQPQNPATGKYRSTFDVNLKQPGTYRIALVNNTVFASWDDNGQPKTWRGTADAFTKEVPANAPGLKSSRMVSRVEVFVTSGKPTRETLKASNTGLEMVPVTHPNDLVTGEPATFQLLLDGKPAAGLEVTLIPGGIRYRDQLHEMKVTTAADGKFSASFKTPGMYWMNATTGGSPRPAGSGSGSGSGSGGPGRMPAGNRASYTATVEVLPQ
jgi:uncharacterized GH25 family protein